MTTRRTIAGVRTHIAKDRPSQLHLAVFVDGTKTDEIHTGEFVDTEGNPYTNKISDVLRIASGHDLYARVMGKSARFEHIS